MLRPHGKQIKMITLQHRIIQKVWNFVKEHNLIHKNDSILLAISGGSDSVFLLHFFSVIKNHLNLNLVAAHLNHSLRGEDSDKDEKFVDKICNDLNIKLVTRKVDVREYAKANKLNIEEAGRILRYSFFNETKEQYRLNKIATGHTSDDNAESIVFNLIRGTGVSGLAGIAIRNEAIIRPILCLTKSEILDFLNENKIKYIIDKSNLSTDFSRNLIRLKVIPELKKINPALSETLLNTSNLFKSLRDFLNVSTEICNGIFNVKKNDQGTALEIKIELLKQLKSIFVKPVLANDSSCLYGLFMDYHPDEFEEDNKNIVRDIKHSEIFSQLRYPLMHHTQKLIRELFHVQLDYHHIENIFSLIDKKKGKSVELPMNLIAIRERGSIIVLIKENLDEVNLEVKIGNEYRENYFQFSMNYVDKNKINFSADRMIEFIDGDMIRGKLLLRKWKAGDKMIPLGLNSYKKVSDILTDSKIAHSIREKVLVLEDDNEIIWLVGVALSDKYKINVNTKIIVKLKVKYEFEF